MATPTDFNSADSNGDDLERWGAEGGATSLEPEAPNPSSEAEDKSRAWSFTEENDWEGESWTVFFSTTDPELSEKVEQLEEYLEAEPDESPYELYEIEELPDEDELEDDEDGEGYYDPEAIRELVPVKLELALEFFAQGGPENTKLEDPLYKLGLFDPNDR